MFTVYLDSKNNIYRESKHGKDEGEVGDGSTNPNLNENQDTDCSVWTSLEPQKELLSGHFSSYVLLGHCSFTANSAKKLATSNTILNF